MYMWYILYMKYIAYIIIFLFFFNIQTALAANPYLTSYTVTPSTVSSGQLISVAWTATDAAGASLVVSCVPGVKVKKQDGSLFPCDTKTTISTQESDSLGFFVVNTSGSTKMLNFTLYLKDSTGTDTSVGQSNSVSVVTMPYPITSFFTTATSTASGATTTVQWTSSELDGVNFSIRCVDNVSVFLEGSSVVLPCGTPMFSTKQSPSGSMVFVFKNKNVDMASVSMLILPYITDGAYDQTHAETIVFDVGSEKITPTQILSFVATPPKVASDDNVSLLWSTKYTNAITLKMDCVEGIKASFVTSTSTSAFPCNKIISEVGYLPNSSTTVAFINSTSDIKTITFTLYPQLPGGGFDGISTQKVSVMVYPKGYVAPAPVTTSALSTYTSVSAQNSSTRKKFVFTRLLKLGTRHTDVTELQKFLATDKAVYPEGTVSGYFGPATQKAIGRFQIKYGLAKNGEAGYGQVGPKTREKLNAVQ